MWACTVYTTTKSHMPTCQPGSFFIGQMSHYQLVHTSLGQDTPLHLLLPQNQPLFPFLFSLFYGISFFSLILFVSFFFSLQIFKNYFFLLIIPFLIFIRDHDAKLKMGSYKPCFAIYTISFKSVLVSNLCCV